MQHDHDLCQRCEANQYSFFFTFPSNAESQQCCSSFLDEASMQPFSEVYQHLVDHLGLLQTAHDPIRFDFFDQHQNQAWYSDSINQ